MASGGRMYGRLADHASLLRLEQPCLYDRQNDELYELNQDGFEALLRCGGSLTLDELKLEDEFLETLMEEGLLELLPEPRPKPIAAPASPDPSLRYLELQITWRCNLACRHCYLGPAQKADLSVARIAVVIREFEAMGGMRLLVSGGEPLMHPRWAEVNALLAAAPLRRVLLSNGLLLSPETAGRLNFDEVQISIDGMGQAHDDIRGKGGFDKAVQAARIVAKAGMDLSVATMAHPGNLVQMEEMAALVAELGAREWGIDAPCIAGRLADEPELAVTPAQAAEAMEHAFGGAYHGGSGGMACGLHLCTVAANGLAAQCGFYLDKPLGRIDEGLMACWARRRPVPISDIPACAKCQAAGDCGGGCRFRAPAPDRPDPVMCALYGMEPAQADEK